MQFASSDWSKQSICPSQMLDFPTHRPSLHRNSLSVHGREVPPKKTQLHSITLNYSNIKLHSKLHYTTTLQYCKFNGTKSFANFPSLPSFPHPPLRIKTRYNPNSFRPPDPAHYGLKFEMFLYHIVLLVHHCYHRSHFHHRTSIVLEHICYCLHI